MDFQLRRLGMADAFLLHQLMAEIYPAAYAYLWQDGGQWYLENLYNTRQLELELSDTDSWFWVVEDQAKNALGWMKVTPMKNAPGLTGKGMYLQRIYLAPAAQGKGLGRFLCMKASDMGKSYDCDYIWLESMDTGPAIGFYEKLGFSIFDQKKLDYPGMNDPYRTLLSMKKDLDIF